MSTLNYFVFLLLFLVANTLTAERIEQQELKLQPAEKDVSEKGTDFI
jgi:hypothetical protein